MFLALVSSKITFKCRKIGMQPTRNFAAFSHLWCLFREVPQCMDLLYNTMDYIDNSDCSYLFFAYSTFDFEKCTFLMWK